MKLDHRPQEAVIVRPAHRPRLSAMLDSAIKNGLVILSAGAGTGKTFAVDAFAAQAKEPVVWVHITRNDACAERFWALLAQAVASWDAQLSDSMQAHAFPETLSGIHHFLLQLTQAVERSGKAIMVFDEVQHLQEGPVTSFLTNLIQQSSRQLYFILILGEGQQLTLPQELHPNLVTDRHLLFTPEEIREYYESLGIVLDNWSLDSVCQLTEGLAIAVYMLGIHLRRGMAVNKQSINSAMSNLFAMFDAELFQPMGQELTRAMVLLAYLDDFTPEMAEELVGIRAEELSALIKNNPLIQYHPGSAAYHFHSLFRQFLTTKQALLSKKIRHAFLRKAARWFEQRGKLVEPLSYYLLCKDYEPMQGVLDKANLPELRIDTAREVEALLEQIPEEYCRQHPMILLYRAFASMMAQRDRRGFELLKELRLLLDQGENTEEAVRARGEAHILQAFLGMRRGSYDFLAQLRAASELLPEGSSLFREGTGPYIGNGSSLPYGENGSGNLLQMKEALIDSTPYLTRLFGSWGRGAEFTAAAEVHYYLGDVEQSVSYAGEAIATAVKHAQWDIACNACYTLVRTSLAKGLLSETEYHLNLLHRYADSMTPFRYFVLPDIADFLVYYYVGIVEKSAGWIRDERQLHLEHALPSAGRGLYTKAVYLVTQKRYYQALTYIDNAIGVCMNTAQWFARINLIILKAYIYDLLDQRQIAAKHLLEAYEMCRANNIIAPFVEFGGNMQSLIRRLRALPGGSPGIPKDWLERVSGAAGKFQHNIDRFRSDYLQRYPQNFSLTQKLSKWEHEALLLLCRGLSNEEIADRMSTDLSAVTKGLADIYPKIGVTSRSEAVNAALGDEIIKKQLQLLEQDLSW